MGTETSSGRRWVGCWAWRQRRSAAGRRREKLWRNVKGKPPSTPWYDRCRHWISSTDHHSVTWVLIPFSILPSLFRKEASPTRHFLQRMSSLNLVRYEIVAIQMFILIIKKKTILNKSFLSFLPETVESDIQAVLIDCSSVIFVDVAGARLFTQVCLKHLNIEDSLVGSFSVSWFIDLFFFFSDLYWLPESWRPCVFGKL